MGSRKGVTPQAGGHRAQRSPLLPGFAVNRLCGPARRAAHKAAFNAFTSICACSNGAPRRGDIAQRQALDAGAGAESFGTCAYRQPAKNNEIFWMVGMVSAIIDENKNRSVVAVAINETASMSIISKAGYQLMAWALLSQQKRKWR